MGNNMADRLLVDVRGIDIESLLDDESMQTALDRVLASGAAGYHGFTNSIG
jgi:hypothetical protein